jgi:hypothetical protein
VTKNVALEANVLFGSTWEVRRMILGDAGSNSVTLFVTKKAMICGLKSMGMRLADHG